MDLSVTYLIFFGCPFFLTSALPPNASVSVSSKAKAFVLWCEAQSVPAGFRYVSWRST